MEKNINAVRGALQMAGPGVNVSRIITLTTDFGLSDPYVGIMKGVIFSINPEASVVDISHQIKAGSIIHAAGLIREAYHFFPEGTVHVVVVDPGVGSERRPIVVKTEGHLFVGPDNGLFSPFIAASQHTKIIHITEKRYFRPDVSPTFHGRDIFAPVAGHLSLGVDPREMGPTISDPVSIALPKSAKKGNILLGEVVRVDHFGNLITNIRRDEMEQFTGTRRPVISVRDIVVEGVSRTYGDVRVGEVLALVGSSGYLEIAVNLGRACDRLGLNEDEYTGVEVEVKRTR